jgi:carboxymethylenebutenolidase
MNKYIQIETPDGSFAAYLAQPDIVEKPVPVIVVIQELFGVNADLRATCDELATLGYLAVSPDLFWRQEPGTDLSDGSESDWTKGLALYNGFDFDAGIADIAATIEATRSLPGSCGKVGLMGFCMGGLLTYLVTAKCGADASVAYYGGGIDQHLELADEIRTPLLMHFGGDDEYISTPAREAIRAAHATNLCVAIFTYPGRKHAFARHGGAHFDAYAAERANRRTHEFFAAHLTDRSGPPPKARIIETSDRRR